MNVPVTMKWIGVVGFASLVLAGCATAGNGSDVSPDATPDRNLITRAEMEGIAGLNLYEAIRRLRPAWLRPRGQAVLTGPDRESLRVYLDRQIFGDIESLTQSDGQRRQRDSLPGRPASHPAVRDGPYSRRHRGFHPWGGSSGTSDDPGAQVTGAPVDPSAGVRFYHDNAVSSGRSILHRAFSCRQNLNEFNAG